MSGPQPARSCTDGVPLMILFNNVSYTYANAPAPSVTGISFTVSSG